MTERYIQQLLDEADTYVSGNHDGSANEATQAVQVWLEPRVEVALRLDNAEAGETPGYKGRRE